MNYTLNIYNDKEKVNTLSVPVVDVLGMYFNTKEIYKHSSKVKTLSYNSTGKILKMIIAFDNGFKYEYLAND